jgi:Holliday junction DNA helicase RuvA
MIGRLRGTIVRQGATSLVIEVGGIGYEVAVPVRTLAELPGVGEDAVLHTHLHVREDQLALYGFAAADDRDLFRLLLGISGVGPKVALAILSTMDADELRGVVATEDAAALTAVPGIGKRSAQKLLLELRPKLELPDGELDPSGARSEVRAALEGLGYQPDEIGGVLRDLPDDLPVEDLLKRSLQTLGRGGES